MNTESFDEVGLDVEKLIYNGRTTIVYWNDGTKNVSTCDKEDTFSEEIGFAICVMKKMFNKRVFGDKLYKRRIAQAIRQNKSVNKLNLTADIVGKAIQMTLTKSKKKK